MNWVKEMIAWMKIRTNVIAAGSNSSKPEYNAKNRIAQMKPVENAAACPTMVIAFVLILDLMVSLDKPVRKIIPHFQKVHEMLQNIVNVNLPHLFSLFVLYKWKKMYPYKNIVPLTKTKPIKMLVWTKACPKLATFSSIPL